MTLVHPCDHPVFFNICADDKSFPEKNVKQLQNPNIHTFLVLKFLKQTIWKMVVTTPKKMKVRTPKKLKDNSNTDKETYEYMLNNSLK